MLDLYEFQTEDVLKLAKQRACLIASEMGTGKTLEAIAIDKIRFNHEHKKDPKAYLPTLIIAPLNTKSSWLDKLEKQCPDVTVTVLDRKNRDAFVQSIMRRDSDIYWMHWDALRLMIDDLSKFKFNHIIADEVHRIANRKAQVTRALKKLKTNYKLGLSGTASGDKPEQLWSVLNWLWPQYYTSFWRFRNHYCVIEAVQRGTATYTQVVGVKNQQSLKAEMDPWYIRHLKRERCCEHHPQGVMSYLPDKEYMTVWVDLSPKQKKLYEQMRKNMVAWVGEHEDSPLTASVVVAQMTRLSQMALATPEINADGVVTLTLPSTKFDAVREIVTDDDERSFVVYTSSRKFANIMTAEFNRLKIPARSLTGETKDRDRATLVKDFQDHKFRILVAVIEAAAEGIDGLQEVCDTAIFVDRSWKTLKNHQAEDRLDREGQKNTTVIIDIMARSTLDFGRWQKLEMKWEWIRAILGDTKVQEKVMK